MKWLTVALVVLVISVLVALAALPDPGYVLIGYGNYSIETTLTVLLLVLALAYGVVRVIAGLWRIPTRFRRWNVRHHDRRLQQDFDLAMTELIEGRPERAERRLARLATSPERPLAVYLTAARVAGRAGADERRDRYLTLARQRHPQAELAIGLTQAELQLSHSQLDQAQTTLARLQALSPHNDQVLRLLVQLYLAQEDWQALGSLLPLLRKSHTLGADQWQPLAVQVYRHRLLELGEGSDLQALRAGWEQLPASVQSEPPLVMTYLEALVRLGASKQAEQLLRAQLQTHWDRQLIYAYGDVVDADAAAQLTVAEGWLQQHGDDPVLMLTLAKISLRNELWGKARSYLEAGIDLEPTPEAYRLLGALLERLDDPEGAALCYRKGIELADRSRPALISVEHCEDAGALVQGPA